MAANRTWDGGGTDNSLLNAVNWVGNTGPVANDSLIFAGSLRLTPELNSDFTINTIDFKAGARAFTLGGTGTFTISGGVTNSAAATETINNGIKIGANQNWKAATGALVFGGPVNLQTFRITSTGNKALTIDGVISGTGGLMQNGGGSLKLTASNTYSGLTTLKSGTLLLGNDAALGTGTLSITGGGKLDSFGAARTIANALQIDNSFTFLGTNALTFNGPISITSGSTVTTNGTSLLSLNGVLNGSRTLVKAGTGSLGLYGANGGTFSGKLQVIAGRLLVGNAGATGTGELTIGNATIEAAGAARTISNALVLTGNPTFAGAYDLTFTGTQDFGSVRTLTVNNPTTTITGNITGAGKGVIKAGAGTLVLSGANTYGSGTVVRNGTLILDSNSAAGDPTKLITVGDVTVGSTTPATLMLSATAGRTVANPISVVAGGTGLRTIGALNTAGVNTFSGAVTLGTGVTLTELAGGEVNFTGVVSGTGGITKTGAGTVRLSNTNTFSGATLVSAGTLAYGASDALGTGTVTINGGVLDMGANRTDSVGAVTLQDGSILGTGTSTLTSTSGFTVRNGTVSARLGGGVSLTKDTSGTVTLSGANTYTGGTNVNAGLLLYGASNVLADSGAVNVNGGALNIGAYSDTVGAVTLASGSILGTSGVLTGASYTLQSGTVTAALGGSGVALTKNTAGTVLISGANSYTGTTTVSAGTLRVGATETLPNATAITMSAGATLDLNGYSNTVGSLAGAGNLLLGTGRLTTGGNNTSTTFTGTIGGGLGTGGLTKTGTGVFTIGGINAYLGSTDVNAGTLALGSSASGPASSRVNVAMGATFNVAGYNASIGSLAGAGSVTLGVGTLSAGGDHTSSTFSGNVSGSGGLTKAGTGTMTLTGANAFTGAFTVADGSVTLAGASGAISGASSVVLRTGTTLVLDNSVTENANRIGNTTAFSIQGGKLQLISDANGTNESVGNLNSLPGPATISVVHNGTALQGSALTFSGRSPAVVGNTVNFEGSGLGGALGTGLTGPHIYITGQSLGLMGAWARVGGDFAEYQIDGVRAFSDYYTGSNGINVNDPSKIVQLSSTSPLAAYTLTNAGLTTDGGLVISDLPLVDLNTDPTRTLNLLTGGLIKKSAPDSTISGAGRLTAGGTAAVALYTAVETGRTLTVASSIINNAGPDGIASNADDGVVSLVKSDFGTLVLSGANAFTGGLYLNEGTVSVSADANLGATAGNLFLSGGTLAVTRGFTADVARRFEITSGLTNEFNIAAGQSLILTGAADRLATGSSASRLNKGGAGNLILGGANPNFTGSLWINAGAVELQNAGSLGSGAISMNGGTLRLRNDATTSFGNPVTILADSTIEAAPLTGGTPVLSVGTLTIGGQTLTLAANSGATLGIAGAILTGDATFNTSAGVTTMGPISGAAGFVKSGAGALQLTAPGTYTGITSVQAGMLQLNHAAAIPNASQVSVAAPGTLNLNNLNASLGSIAGSGAITLGSGTLTVGGNGTASNFAGVISGTGGLTKVAVETLTLSGANSYTGATTISAGSIQLAASNSLPSATAVSIAGGATLNLAGYTQAVGSVSGAGTVALGAGALAVGNGSNTTFSGDIAGSGSVTKTGAGTWSLSGESSFTGSLAVSAGTLEVLSANALGNAAGGTSVSAGAQILIGSGLTISSEPLTLAGTGSAGAGALRIDSGSGTWAGPLSFSADASTGAAAGAALTLGGTVSLSGKIFTVSGAGDTEFSGTVTGAGTLEKTGAGTLILDTANSFAGPTVVAGGTLRLLDDAALGASGAGNQTDIRAGASLVLGNPAGTNLRGERLYLAGNGVSGTGALQIEVADSVVEGAVTLTADASVNIAAGTSLSLVGGIGESVAGRSLAKNGTGTLILGGTTTFTGTFGVNAGTLRIAADNTINGNPGLSLAAGATLDLNDFSDSLGSLSGAGTVTFGASLAGGNSLTVGANGANTTFSGLITGFGDFEKIGAGSLTLANANTYTGLTTVNGGTLVFGVNDAIAVGDVSINGSGTVLDLGANHTATMDTVTLTGGASIVGSGTSVLTGNVAFAMESGSVSAILGGVAPLNKTTDGTLILSGANSYQGVTTISAGTVIVGTDSPNGNDGALGKSNTAVLLGDGATPAGNDLSLLVNGPFAVGRAITVGSVANTEAYAVTIGGTNTSGTATFSGDITLGTAATNYTTTLRAATGGTVEFRNGTWVTNGRAIQIGSTGNNGTVTISKSLVTTGGVTVNAGTLLLGAANALGDTTTPVTVAGGALNVSGFADTVKSLTITSGSLTLGIANNTPALLTITDALTFGGTVNVASTGTQTQGLYKLAGYASQSGTFTTGTLPARYKLVVNATELNLQHLADHAFSAASPATINIITGATTPISATLTNTAPDLSVALSVSLANGGGTGGTVSGLASSAGLTLAPGASSSITGTFTAGAVGIGRTWSITNTDANAVSATVSAGGTANVYNHSAPTLTIASGDNQSVIRNGSLSAALTLANTAGVTPAPLDVNTLSNLTGTTGSGVVASGGTRSYTATNFVTNTVGVNKTLAVSLMAGDQQTVVGASPLSTLGQTITYSVYNHSDPTLTVASGNNQSIIVGGTVGTATVSLSNTLGVTPAPLDVNTLGNLTGTTGSGVVASGGTGTYAATGFATGSVGLNKTLVVSLNAGDQQTIVGADPLSPLSTNFTYNVYDHASPSSVTGGSLTLGNIHAGYSGTKASTNSNSVSNTSGTRVNLKGSTAAIGNLSISSVNGLVQGGVAGTISATLANGQGVGVINQNFAYTFADDSALSGASANVGTATINVTGQVYSGAMIWTGASGGSFGTGANWNDSADANVHVAPGLDAGFTGVDSATFGNTSGSVTVNLNGASPSLNAISFNSTGSYTIAQGSGGSITLAGITPAITAAGTHTISAPVTFAANTAVTVAGSSDGLSISGIIGESGGSRSLTKSGSGSLTLSAANTYTGNTFINGGAIVAGNNLAFGGAARTVTLNGGGLASNNDTRSLANPIIVTAAGGQITGSNSVTFTGAVTSGGAGSKLKVNLTDGTKTVTINPVAAGSFAPGEVELSSGTLLLGGANKIADTTNLTMNGGRLNTGGFSETVGVLTLSANSTIDFGTTDNVRLQFSSASWTGGTMTIANWTGDAWLGNNADQFLVMGSVSQDFLNNIGFQGFASGAIAFDRGGGLFEVVPVPEPTTIIGAMALVGLIGFRERRRLARFCRFPR